MAPLSPRGGAGLLWVARFRGPLPVVRAFVSGDPRKAGGGARGTETSGEAAGHEGPAPPGEALLPACPVAPLSPEVGPSLS